MPVVQIDWTSIKALFGDVTEFIALTSRQRALLLSLTEQLTWRKTFDDFGYDWADKDTLDLEIADLERNLTMPVVLSDLIGYIDEIEDLLRALNSTANCCGPVDVTDGDQYTDPVTDASGNVPQNIIDAGYATGTSDWDGFYDYKCMISHVMIDDMEYSLRAIHERFDDVGVIIGGVGTVAAIIGSILAAVATGGVTLLLEAIAALGAASAVWGGLTELGDVAVESLADKVSQYHDALACAIYNSDGTYDAMDELQAAIDTFFTDTEALILKNMNLGPKLKGLYAGRYDQQDIAQNMADNGFDPADYDCSCTDDYYDVPANYVIERVAFTGPNYGATGISHSGHILTLTNYTYTGGFGYYYTAPSLSGYTYCGYIILREGLPLASGWTANANDCGATPQKILDTNIPDGYVMGFAQANFAADKTAFADFISDRSAHVETFWDACPSPTQVAQRSVYGNQSGTFKYWHIFREN